MRFRTSGESGLLIELGKDIDSETFEHIYSLAAGIKALNHPAIVEIVPAYASLLVMFDPLRTGRSELQDMIGGIEHTRSVSVSGVKERKLFTIPVAYGGDYGPDLGFVAHCQGVSSTELIKIHTSSPCMIYMLGFTPGFPYCRSADVMKSIPRLEKPRMTVPAGSVGCAGTQTGIYPVESPGGWRLIGRTPVQIFRRSEQNPFLFSPGDFIRFIDIGTDEYKRIKILEEKGEYQPVAGNVEDYGAGGSLRQ